MREDPSPSNLDDHDSAFATILVSRRRSTLWVDAVVKVDKGVHVGNGEGGAHYISSTRMLQRVIDDFAQCYQLVNGRYRRGRSHLGSTRRQCNWTPPTM